jgi:hypothetical protein
VLAGLCCYAVPAGSFPLRHFRTFFVLTEPALSDRDLPAGPILSRRGTVHDDDRSIPHLPRVRAGVHIHSARAGVSEPSRGEQLTYAVPRLSRSTARHARAGIVHRWRSAVGVMTRGKNTHPKDCPDQAAASTDRKSHDAAAKKREVNQQQLARAAWFDWFPPRKLR